MDARDTWQALQAHLKTARVCLEAGDRTAALAAVDAALAIDPDFLAARSLRERIVSPVSTPAPVRTSPWAAAAAPARSEAAAPVVAPSTPAVPDQAAATDRYAGFEQRTKRRRADRRLEAARAALASGRVRDAGVALNEVIELDPNLPELRELTQQFESLKLSVQRPRRRGRWLAAAAAFGGVVLGASWLQEERGLLSPPVSPPTPVTEAPREAASVADNSATATAEPEPTPMSTPVATGGAASERTARDVEETSRSEPRETIARAVESRPVEPPAASSALPVPSPTPPPAPPPPAAAPAVPPPAQRPVTELTSIAPVSAPSLPEAPPRAAPAATPASSVAATASRDDEARVTQVLQRYRTAYEGLDARSARAVWPAVNESALARAFGDLSSQTLKFDVCYIQLNSPAEAAATCRGSASYIPKIGNREPHVEPRTWKFTLRRSGEDWKIESARTDR